MDLKKKENPLSFLRTIACRRSFAVRFPDQLHKTSRIIAMSFIAFVCTNLSSSPRTSAFTISEKDALGIIEQDLHDQSTLSSDDIIAGCSSLLSSKEKLNLSFVAELYLVRARIYIRQSEFDKAIRDLNEVIRVRSLDPNAHALLAYSLARLGLSDKSKLHFDKIDSEDSDEYDVYLCRAAVLFHKGDFRSSINVLNRGLSIHPSSQGYLLRAKALLAIGDSAKSLNDLEKCISKWPNSATYEAYHLRCKLLRSLNRYEEALENNFASYKLGLDEKSMLLESWRIYHSLQRYHCSEMISRKLMALYPADNSSLLASASSFNALGDYQKAVDRCLSVLMTNPKCSEACIELGWAYSGNKNYRESIIQFDNALKLDSSSEYALCGKAILLCSCPDKRVRNVDTAHLLAKRACEISKWSKPYCIVTLALTNASLNRFEDALALTEKALRLLPTTANSRALQYKEFSDLLKHKIPAPAINVLCPMRFFIHR